MAVHFNMRKWECISFTLIIFIYRCSFHPCFQIHMDHRLANLIIRLSFVMNSMIVKHFNNRRGLHPLTRNSFFFFFFFLLKSQDNELTMHFSYIWGLTYISWIDMIIHHLNSQKKMSQSNMVGLSYVNPNAYSSCFSMKILP